MASGLPRQEGRTVWFSLLSNLDRTTTLTICILVPSFQNSFARATLWKFDFSQHITCFVINYLTHCLTVHRTSGSVLLHYVSGNRQCVKFVFVVLSIHRRGLQAFSACTVYDTDFPKQSAIRRRSLAEKISLLPISVIKSFDSWLKWRSSLLFSQNPSATVFLFGWFSNCFINLLNVFSICFNLFNSGMWNAKDSKINKLVTAPGFPVLMNFILTVIGFSRFWKMYILLNVLVVRQNCCAW